MKQNFTIENPFLEVICGPMFAGKTETLIKRIKRYHYANVKFQVFKHGFDLRYAEEEIATHYGMKEQCILLSNLSELKSLVEDDTKVVFIDEVQFFPENDIKYILELLEDKGIAVITSGLNSDFRGEPFPSIIKLMGYADYVTNIHSICAVCGHLASKSQRLIDGEPARYNDPIIVVGGTDSYEPRCRSCHEVIKD